MNITSKRKNTEAENADSTSSATLGRRGILGGLVALPVLYGLGASATSASAAPLSAGRKARQGGAPEAADVLVRGEERRYNAPLLAPGTRLVLPAGIKATPLHDIYQQPRLGSTASAWPHLTATDGSNVDGSVIPERGGATRAAILSGFTDGWYELVHANGRSDRVTWDARELPFLWFYGEFGATDEDPYKDRFYTLALQPLSLNPYSRSTLSR